MTLSRVAMVGAVLLGVVAGTPLAAAQSVPVPSPLPPSTVVSPPVEPMPMPTVDPLVPLSADLPALGSPAPVVESVTPTTSAEATPVAAPACVPWTVTTVADGFGVLENLAFDGDGTMLLSESIPFGDGAIRTLTPSGAEGTLVSEVQSPGGIVVDGDRVVFTTGNNVMAGLWGSANGTVDAVDRDGGNRTTLTEGLSMPNGLGLLDNGDLLVTHAFGDAPGLTRIPASDPATAATVRTDIGSANGLFIASDKVYVGNTVDRSTEVHVLDAGDLTGEVTTLTLPGGGAANAGDDLAVDADGLVYIALNGAGKIVRIDPSTGDSCEIATDLPMTSSVRFGAGAGWDPTSLYTTSFDGTVHRLTPPEN
jgi:hypothetical protein